MLEIATATALVHAAQLNVIEFHTWNATVKSIENPDRLLSTSIRVKVCNGGMWSRVRCSRRHF